MRAVTSKSESNEVSIREYQYSTFPDIAEALRGYGVSLGADQLDAQASGGKWQTMVERGGSRIQLTVFPVASSRR
ncbi:hypothetical protein GCM10010198_39770 [Nocardia seriolae]|nr:hypothetical protein NSERKGN1266_65130 [Nocardia seriolae]BEK98310.1 hypothetical protein NSER024013_62160 [Nocardia seriolae]GEM24111.1 hypothetical protein NS2_23500 [Nocardia seriolae NBRC 15557]